MSKFKEYFEISKSSNELSDILVDSKNARELATTIYDTFKDEPRFLHDYIIELQTNLDDIIRKNKKEVLN